MAELKFRDEYYDVYDNELDFETESKIYQDVKRPDIITVPASPLKKLAKITRFERRLVLGLLASFIFLGVLTINIRTRISSAENDIAAIQVDINNQKSKRVELQQEKNELSKTERIQKIAEEKGLSIKQDNIRNVK